MEITFRTKNEKQIEAAEAWLDDTVEEILYGGGKGGGKSYLGVSLIFGDALTYPETHYFIARAELNDLRRFTIPTIHEVFKNWGLKIEDYATYNGQDNVYNLYNGSKVFLLACKLVPSDPLFERFGSMQMTRGMIEEGGEIVEAAKANLWLSVGRWKNGEHNLKKKLLITANPKKGWMKREFVDPHTQNALPKSRKFIKALAVDNKYLPQDYIETLANEKDAIRRQRLYLGDWEYDENKDSLVSWDALSDAFTNTITLDNQKYLTCDVARFGDDSSTFYYWEGLKNIRIERRQKQSITETISNIRDILAREQIPYSNCIVDEDGVGGGVVDGLNGVRGFVANSTPLPTKTEIRQRNMLDNTGFYSKPNYQNLKAQCGYKLAEVINEHKISFAAGEYREEIITDLSAMLRGRDMDSDGKLKLRSKDDVKIEIGRSPDFGDPILMRMYFEVLKEAVAADPEQERVFSFQKQAMQRKQGINRSNK
jgi:phage terminase large subunit